MCMAVAEFDTYVFPHVKLEPRFYDAPMNSSEPEPDQDSCLC